MSYVPSGKPPQSDKAFRRDIALVAVIALAYLAWSAWRWWQGAIGGEGFLIRLTVIAVALIFHLVVPIIGRVTKTER